MRNKAIDAVILTLVIIGAVNWGLIGFFGFNLVSAVFGSMTWVSRIIYALVGLGGLYLISFYGNLGEEEAQYRKTDDAVYLLRHPFFAVFD